MPADSRVLVMPPCIQPLGIRLPNLSFSISASPDIHWKSVFIMFLCWILKRSSQIPSLYPGEATKGDTKWINVSIPASKTTVLMKFFLQGLRGICACCVIIHHLFMTLRDDVVYPGSPHARLSNIW